MITRNLALLIIWYTAVVGSIRLASGAPFARGVDRTLLRTNLLVWWEPNGHVRPVQDVDQWQTRRTDILKSMQAVMGGIPNDERRCELNLTVHTEVDCGNYVRRFIEYSAEPGARVPAYLLIPKKGISGGTKLPAVLALHQTSPEGPKVVVGLTSNPDDEYGVHLAERGFVVLAPPYTMSGNYWPNLDTLGYRSGTMKSIWDNVRGIDLLASLPYVRTSGFGVIGHSLGGHNGIFTASFDQRIKVIIASCGLDSFMDYSKGDPQVWQPERGWCQKRYMPGLAAYNGQLHQLPFDFPEIIGTLAPRVCFLSAPKDDTNFGWKSVDSIGTIAHPVFDLYGATDHLQIVHPECAHRFPPEVREQAYLLLEKHLQ